MGRNPLPAKWHSPKKIMQNSPNLQRRELQAEEKLEIHRVVSDIIN